MTIAIAIVGGVALFLWILSTLWPAKDSIFYFLVTSVFCLVIGLGLAIPLFVIALVKSPEEARLVLSLFGAFGFVCCTIGNFLNTLLIKSFLAALLSWLFFIALFVLALVK